MIEICNKGQWHLLGKLLWKSCWWTFPQILSDICFEYSLKVAFWLFAPQRGNLPFLSFACPREQGDGVRKTFGQRTKLSSHRAVSLASRHVPAPLLSLPASGTFNLGGWRPSKVIHWLIHVFDKYVFTWAPGAGPGGTAENRTNVLPFLLTTRTPSAS